jgi:PleD family two-component response regulator
MTDRLNPRRPATEIVGFAVVMVETMTTPTSEIASQEAHLLPHGKQTPCHDGTSTAIRCLIVNDNGHFRQAVSDVLERERIIITGVASTSAEALRRFDKLRPDVTLVDINFGHESGFDLAQQLTAATFTE